MSFGAIFAAMGAALAAIAARAGRARARSAVSTATSLCTRRGDTRVWRRDRLQKHNVREGDRRGDERRMEGSDRRGMDAHGEATSVVKRDILPTIQQDVLPSPRRP